MASFLAYNGYLLISNTRSYNDELQKLRNGLLISNTCLNWIRLYRVLTVLTLENESDWSNIRYKDDDDDHIGDADNVMLKREDYYIKSGKREDAFWHECV